MTQFNRRQWLKTAGLTGAISLLGGAQALTAKAGSSLEKVSHPKAGIARLSSNENPYGPSERVRRAIQESFDLGCRYPYSYSQELLAAIAKKEGVPSDHIVITAGSTEGLKIAALLYGKAGSEVVSPDPTFRALMTYAEQWGAKVHWVPLDEQLNHDLEAMDRHINERTSLVYVCNPNNPTGTLLPGARLRDFCSSSARRAMVFVDEAYCDFITEPNYPSMVELVRKGENVIVARTFSKVYGLAGLRIGYLVAPPEIARRLSQAVVAFTNTLALVAAKTALEDDEFYRFSLRKNEEGKRMICATLDKLGLHYAPSHANFVFFKAGRDVNGLSKELYQQGVQVGRAFPPMNDWCRVSTGKIEEVELFCSSLRKVVQG